MNVDAVAHAAGAEIRPVPARVAVAVLAGFAAAALARMVMSLLPEGDAAPRIAVAAAWPDAPSNVVPAASHSAHYLSGILAAVATELLLVAVEGLRTVEVLVLGWVSVARIAATAAVAVAVAAVFAGAVLPRVGPERLPRYEERVGGIRRDATVAAVAYGVVLAAVTPALYLLLPV
jgi:hypothetical protein